MGKLNLLFWICFSPSFALFSLFICFFKIELANEFLYYLTISYFVLSHSLLLFLFFLLIFMKRKIENVRRGSKFDTRNPSLVDQEKKNQLHKTPEL